ncbi:MAG: DHHA1 domain-containing protein, partial [Bacteroidota bacterium]
LSNGKETLKVIDTQKENELIVHLVDKLPEDPSGEWKAVVNPVFRDKVKSNHTATHLLHAALRNHLGSHVEQRGSLVNDKLLRFDFSHFQKVTDEEMARIEKEVNQKIAAGIELVEYREMPIDDAKGMGAMALFGEKYGDKVRVIVFDPTYSVELCGGIHVDNTREIRLFKLVSEGSVAAGIRRVEAYTADHAFTYLTEKADKFDRMGALLKNTKDPEKALNDLTNKAKELEKQIQQLSAEKVGRLKDELKNKATALGDIQVIREKVSVGTSDDLKRLSYDLSKVTENTLIVLGAVIKEKPLLSVIMSNDLAEKKAYHAGNMVRELAKEIKGGGGGQPFYATAGGKDVQGLEKAFKKVEELV